MSKIYVAASFSYQDEEKTNQRKKEILEVVERIKRTSKQNFDWFLPQQLVINHAWDLSLEEWSYAVYQKDIDGLNDADIVLFISYGKENNSGSVWECGYAFAKNIPVIVIKMTNDVESIMVFGSAKAILMYDEIDSYDWETLPRYKTKLHKLS